MISEYTGPLERARSATLRFTRDSEDSLRKFGKSLDDAMKADKINLVAQRLGRVGLTGVLMGVPGAASAAGASLALLPAAALSGAAGIAVLATAVNGVGEAMAAVAEGDTKKLGEAMAKLTVEAQDFVKEYQRVRPLLQELARGTQGAFFTQLIGDLDQLANLYVPMLLRQMPRLASEIGRTGAEFMQWAGQPEIMAKVNRQFDLAIDLTEDFGRILRSATGILLDLGDAGADFTRDTVSGLAKGVEGLERWIATARSTGQVNQILENGGVIIQRLGQLTAELGVLLADVMDNPALVSGAEALFDVLGMTLDIVRLLLTAFEALPEGVQQAVVVFAVFGGVVMIMTGRVLALKVALDQAKLSAMQTGSAFKTAGTFLAGPWGMAIAAATIGIGIYAAEQQAAKARIDAVTGSLDKQTGAFTAQTRAVIAAELEADNTLRTWAAAGVAGDVVVDAVLGNADAMAQLEAAMQRADGVEKWWLRDKSLPQLREMNGEVNAAVEAQKRVEGASREATKSMREQIITIEALGNALKAQNDPVFALIKTQQDLTAAQTEYDKAVREHGKTSKEAQDASIKLAELSIALATNVGALGDTFDGKLSPALRATLEAAGLTEEQIKNVERQFIAAKAAGDKFATKYEAEVITEAEQAKRELDAVIAKTLALKDKTIRISAQVYWTSNGDLKVPGGTLLRREGGMREGTRFAADGLLREGQISPAMGSGPRYGWAEPQTGGEIFLPRYGNQQRGEDLLANGARWYGGRFTPAAAVGAGAGATYNNSLTINNGGGSMMTVGDYEAGLRRLDIHQRVNRPG